MTKPPESDDIIVLSQLRELVADHIDCLDSDQANQALSVVGFLLDFALIDFTHEARNTLMEIRARLYTADIPDFKEYESSEEISAAVELLEMVVDKMKTQRNVLCPEDVKCITDFFYAMYIVEILGVQFPLELLCRMDRALIYITEHFAFPISHKSEDLKVFLSGLENGHIRIMNLIEKHSNA
ncbi:hypothetical protein KKF73_05350 [Patescibacteria group bacterium]|nr:hypothetical protein [Patescibacteria group bacterium]